MSSRVRLLDEPSRVGVELERPAIMAGIPMPGWVRVRCDGETSDVLCVVENIEALVPEHVAHCACGRELRFYDLRNEPKRAPKNALCSWCENQKKAGE